MLSSPLFKKNDIVRIINKNKLITSTSNIKSTFLGDLFIIISIELEDSGVEYLQNIDKKYFPFYKCKNNNGWTYISEELLAPVKQELFNDIARYCFIKNDLPTKVEQINELFHTNY